MRLVESLTFVSSSRGPVIGPLVMAGVLVDEKDLVKRSLNLKEKKKRVKAANKE